MSGYTPGGSIEGITVNGWVDGPNYNADVDISLTPPLVTPAMNAFAGREARARKCRLPRPRSITVELAVLIDGEGGVRTVVPRAIDCATVEQYAAGLAASFARGNMLPRSAGAGEQWYKTSLTFSWAR